MRSDAEIVPRLRKEGPLTYEELGLSGGFNNSVKQRYGIQRILIRSSHKGSAKPRGRQKPVYYLPEHDPRDVVRKYLSVNPRHLEDNKRTISQMFGNHSSEMQEAWQAVSGEFDVDTYDVEGGQMEAFTCSFCGDEVLNLPTHLPECEEAP